MWRGLSNPSRTVKLITKNDITNDITKLLSIRGGAKAPPTATLSSLNNNNKKKKKKKKMDSVSRTRSKKTITGQHSIGSTAATKTALDDAMKRYGKILPLTRKFMTTCVVMTLLSVIGGDAFQTLGSFDLQAIFRGQIWRVLTSATFLGGPSINLIMQFYYIFQHGSQLEQKEGTSQFGLFLLVQTALLGILSATILPSPFFANSIVTAMLWVVSRENPHQNTKWIVFNIPSWMLPFAFLVGDVLNAQSPAAAIPHIMGILTGHFYFFHKTVNVKLDNPDWLTAPDKLKRRYDLDGLDSKQTDTNDDDGGTTMESIRAARRKRRNKKR